MPHGLKLSEERGREPEQTPVGFFEQMFRTNKWPGWAFLLFSVFTLVPDWQSRLSFWISALHEVGGLAMIVVNAIPFVGFVSAGAGFLYIAAVVWQEDIGQARAWLPLASWTLFFVFMMTYGSLALFASFVVSSKIPETMRFVEQQREQRYLTAKQLDKLKENIAPIKDNIPPFTVMAGRDPEILQYAHILIDGLKASGLKIMKDNKDQEFPEATDLQSTTWRNIILVVKYREAPIRPAVLLSKALNFADIKTMYVSEPDGDDNALLLIVGLKNDRVE